MENVVQKCFDMTYITIRKAVFSHQHTLECLQTAADEEVAARYIYGKFSGRKKYGRISS